MPEKLHGAEVQETQASSHQARIRPDKSLLSEEIRKMFLTCLEIEGHQHESKDIIYFPQEIFREKIFDKFVFFVPAVRPGTSEERLSLPIFMAEFSTEQETELIACARKKKIRLFKNYFCKPKISIDYGEREDICPGLEDNQLEDNQEENFQGETPLNNEVHAQTEHPRKKISVTADIAAAMGYVL